MSELIDFARDFARRYHANQKYGDLPYYDAHLEPVRFTVESLGGGDFEQAVALLHDILEDTDCTMEDLMVFPLAVRIHVQCLTRQKNETYDSYMERIISWGLYPSRVKLADSMMNLRSSLMDPISGQKQYRISRYTKNIHLLYPVVFGDENV